jgi:hypothetical protein
MPTDPNCLSTLAQTPTRSLPSNENEVNLMIENFKTFYEKQGVLPERIFLSGVVSAKKISELAQDVEYLTIQLAKRSSDVTNLTDFTFIISQCDKDAAIIPSNKFFGLRFIPELVFNNVPNFTPLFMDASCCRNPPGQ